MPHTQSNGKRSFLKFGQRERKEWQSVFCTVKGKKVIVLHAFIKKSAKTPKQDLDLALKRMAEVNQDG